MKYSLLNPETQLREELEQLQRQMLKIRKARRYDELEDIESKVDQLHRELSAMVRDSHEGDIL